MLSIVFRATTIAMNRGEQESLFRQSHDIRIQQSEKAENERIRHFSYGNIHQVSNLHSQASNSRSFGEDRPFGTAHCDDLVLSVLKTPLKESSLTTPTPSPQSCAYTALQGSEDELVDDVESAKETTELQCERERSSPRAFQFLRRFRGARPQTQRFETHHRRVPTPIRRKSRARSKSQADILDSGVTPTADDEAVEEDDVDEADDATNEPAVGTGIPDPYYPIALPIDQAFKAKYVFHHRRGKTFQERLYVFLEHPGGWLCFIYHFTV